MAGTKWASPGFDSSRQVVTFILGAFVIVYSTISQAHDLLDATVGLVLVGIVPIDIILSRYFAGVRNGATEPKEGDSNKE